MPAGRSRRHRAPGGPHRTRSAATRPAVRRRRAPRPRRDRRTGLHRLHPVHQGLSHGCDPGHPQAHAHRDRGALHRMRALHPRVPGGLHRAGERHRRCHGMGRVVRPAGGPCPAALPGTPPAQGIGRRAGPGGLHTGTTGPCCRGARAPARPGAFAGSKSHCVAGLERPAVCRRPPRRHRRGHGTRPRAPGRRAAVNTVRRAPAGARAVVHPRAASDLYTPHPRYTPSSACT